MIYINILLYYNPMLFMIQISKNILSALQLNILTKSVRDSEEDPHTGLVFFFCKSMVLNILI